MNRHRNFIEKLFLGAILTTSFCACKNSQPPAENITSVTEIKLATNSVAPRPEPKNLGDWVVTEFGGHGEIFVTNSEVKINMGADLSGVNWAHTNDLPKTNYEIELDAMKLEGSDFFCGLTFPVNDSFCSLIVGGWGGGVVGLSSIDRLDASENETSKNLYFKNNRWFHIRLRVQPEKIETWIDADKIIEVGIAGRKISMRYGDIELSKPIGIATYQTTALIKNFKITKLK